MCEPGPVGRAGSSEPPSADRQIFQGKVKCWREVRGTSESGVFTVSLRPPDPWMITTGSKYVKNIEHLLSTKREGQIIKGIKLSLKRKVII